MICKKYYLSLYCYGRDSKLNYKARISRRMLDPFTESSGTFCKMDNEIWKDIPGYEGLYCVSNYGRIKSLDMLVRTKGGKKAIRKGRILTPVVNKDGYHIVSLCKDCVKKGVRIHRIVATVFVPNPFGYNIVNHKDRNPSNNASYNLEWCDPTYNSTYDGARSRSSETRYNNKIGFKNVAQYDMFGNLIAVYDSTASAARETGCHQGAISNNCTGRSKSAGGFRWSFVSNE